jgi:hypothetical protein
LPTERHALSLIFEHRCAACRALLPVGWHADHVVPLADGGADGAGNMQPLCPPCHALKTARENSSRSNARATCAACQPACKAKRGSISDEVGLAYHIGDEEPVDDESRAMWLRLADARRILVGFGCA